MISKMTSHQRLGNAIKMLRTNYGLKQAELARLINKTPQSLWKLEKGDPVSTETLIKVLDHLGITDLLIELITTQMTPPEGKIKSDKRQSKRIKALMSCDAKSIRNGSIAAGVEKALINYGDAPVHLKPEVDASIAIDLLQKYPERYYRIDEQSYRELMGERVKGLQIATITMMKRVMSEERNKVPHPKRVFFVTTLEGAKATDLTWHVNHRLRNPERVINVELDRAQFNIYTIEELDALTESVREHFEPLGIFVDEVLFSKHSRPVSIKHEDKPIGMRYQLHFEDWLEGQLHDELHN